MTTRRALLGGLAASTLAPAELLAQPVRKPYRIGILGLAASSDLAGAAPRSATVQALLRGLADLGYVYGRDIVTEARGSDGRLERMPAVAAELVALAPDVIVATGPALPSLRQATATLPVVMAASSDPIGSGLVQSLGKPGGNMTGLSLQSTDTTGKRLELLKELAPGTAPVAVLWDRQSHLYWQAAQAAARVRGWKLLSFEVRDASGIEAAFEAARSARAGTALVTGAAIFFPNRQRVAEIAASSRLPVMYELRPYAEAGGLVSYGADIDHIWRQAAGFVDKILKGTKPADLPVEQPTKFELVINLKAARAMGLAIPPSLRLRADEVIE